jgi:hypothetical protein
MRREIESPRRIRVNSGRDYASDMPGELLVAIVSGVCALVGGALSPLLSRIGRKRDDVVALRTEWAKRLLVAYRQINGTHLSSSVELPSVELELLEPRVTAQIQSWMGYRQILANVQWNWIRLEDARRQSTGGPDGDWNVLRDRVGKESTRAKARTQIVLAEWARGSRKWPRWRIALMVRSTGRQIQPAARRLQLTQGFDPDRQ